MAGIGVRSAGYDRRPYLPPDATIGIYDNSGEQDVAGTDVTLNLDTELLNTNDGAFVLTTDVLTINTGGKYAFSYRATVENAGNNKVEVWLERDEGSGFSEISGSKAGLIGIATEDVTTITTDTTLTSANSVVLCDASAGNITVTLPAAADNTDQEYTIKKIDSSVNTVTVDANASETVDDATTAVLTDQYESIRIVCDGSAWYIG